MIDKQDLFDKIKEENTDNAFITDEQIWNMVEEQVEGNENTTHSSNVYNVEDLVDKLDNVTVKGNIVAIGHTKEFRSRKGKHYTLRKYYFVDNTGICPIEAWNNDIKKMDSFIGDTFEIGLGGVFAGLSTHYNEYDKSMSLVVNSRTAMTEEDIDLPGNYEEWLPSMYTLDELEECCGDLVGDTICIVASKIITVGKPVCVGAKKTPLRKVLLRGEGSDGPEYVLNVWGNDIKVFLSLLDEPYTGLLNVYCRVSKYNNTYSLNYVSDYMEYMICDNFPDPKSAEMKYMDLSEIETLAEDDTCNVCGRITRIYNDIPYNGGYITTYKLDLGGDTSIEFTMFGETGRQYGAAVGEIITIYNAHVSFDSYNYCNKLIHNYDTICSFRESEDMPKPDDLVTDIAHLEEAADNMEYADLHVFVIEKRQPMIYQRSDGTSGTLCRCKVIDPTGICNLIIWGDNHSMIQYNDQYYLFNVKVKENFDLGEYEVHADNRTRIIQHADTMFWDRTLFDNTIFKEVKDSIPDDDLGDLVKYEGSNAVDVDIYEYPRCPTCNGNLREMDRGWWCDKCEENVVNPRILGRIDFQLDGVNISCWDNTYNTIISSCLDDPHTLHDKREEFERIFHEKEYYIFGMADYDEKTDTKYIRAMWVTYPYQP